VVVNAWFTPRTLDGARFGWPFKALYGLQGTSPTDVYPDPLGEGDNRLRDLRVSERYPNEWFICAPGSAACHSFDRPCEPTDAGVICRRTIESFDIDRPDPPHTERRDVRSHRESVLYLVLAVPGHWTEDDEIAGRAPKFLANAREWCTLRWPKAK
jgi:hypothetical protein